MTNLLLIIEILIMIMKKMIFCRVYENLYYLRCYQRCWASLGRNPPDFIHECFEKVFDIPSYLQKRNDKFNTNDQWEGQHNVHNVSFDINPDLELLE